MSTAIDNQKGDYFNKYVEDPNNNHLKKSRMSKLCNSISSAQQPSFKLKNKDDQARKTYSSLSSPNNTTTIKSNSNQDEKTPDKKSKSSTVFLKYLKKKNEHRTNSGEKKDIVDANKSKSKVNDGDDIILLPEETQEQQDHDQEQPEIWKNFNNDDNAMDSYYDNDNNNDYNTNIKKVKKKSKKKKSKNMKKYNRVRANTSTTSVTASFSSNSFSFKNNKNKFKNYDPSSTSMFYLQEMYNTLPPMAQQEHQCHGEFGYQHHHPLSSFIHPNFYDPNKQIYRNMYQPQPVHHNSIPPHGNPNLGISRPPSNLFPSWNHETTPKSLFFPKEFDTFSTNSQEDGFYISFIEKNDTASTLSYDSMLNTPKESKKKKKRLEIRIPSFGNASNCGSKNNPIIKISSSPLLQQYRQPSEEEGDEYDHHELEKKLHELLYQIQGNKNIPVNQEDGAEHTATPIVHPSIHIDENQTTRQYFVFNHGSFASSYNSTNNAPKIQDVAPQQQIKQANQGDIYTYCSSSSSSVSSQSESSTSSSYCEDFNVQQFVLESSPTQDENYFDKPLDFDNTKYSFEDDIIGDGTEPFDFFDNDINLFDKENSDVNNITISTVNEAIHCTKRDVESKAVAPSSSVSDNEKDESAEAPTDMENKTIDTSASVVSTSSLTNHASNVFGVKLRPSSRHEHEKVDNV